MPSSESVLEAGMVFTAVGQASLVVRAAAAGHSRSHKKGGKSRAYKPPKGSVGVNESLRKLNKPREGTAFYDTWLAEKEAKEALIKEKERAAAAAAAVAAAN